MALGTEILRLGMLVMAKVAIGVRTIMRRLVRILWLYFGRLLGQLGRLAMTAYTLAHLHRLRFLYLAMTLGALNAPEGVKMATRYFGTQGTCVAFSGNVTNKTALIGHIFYRHVFFRKHFFK